MFGVATGNVVACFVAKVTRVENVVDDCSVLAVVKKFKLMCFLEKNKRIKISFQTTYLEYESVLCLDRSQSNIAAQPS